MEKNIREFGYNSDLIARLNEYGNYEWETEDTLYEYNPADKTTRHCGKGEGCFWTDWE